MSQRTKRNSSKVNLTLSVCFHTALIGVLVFFAAREGMLGNRLKQITVTMVPKEKKPEPPKEKPVERKIEPPKLAETPKMAAAEPPKTAAVAPPPASEPASVAPAAVVLPTMDFSDGAHDVQSVSDPNAIYKGMVEHALRSRWNRPEHMDDRNLEAEIDLTVDSEGKLSGYRWLRGSGDARWDNSIKAAIAQTSAISRPPPKGFPPTFTVRFDVETGAEEDVIQLSSR